jgi:hypothetical protein
MHTLSHQARMGWMYLGYICGVGLKYQHGGSQSAKATRYGVQYDIHEKSSDFSFGPISKYLKEPHK